MNANTPVKRVLIRQANPNSSAAPNTPQQGASLRHTLAHTAQINFAVQAGQRLSHTLKIYSEKNRLASNLRGAVQDLAFLTQRKRGAANAVFRRLVTKPCEPIVEQLLLTCIALLLPAEKPKYTAPTVLNEAVSSVALLLDNPAAVKALTGFTNAVLRRFLREQTTLLPQVISSDVSAQYNFPPWWVKQVQRDYPNDWQAILTSSHEAAPLTLRVNTAAQTLSQALALLEAADLSPRVLNPSSTAIALGKGVDVNAIPRFAEGFFSVQDEAAQRAAGFLGLFDGAKVLDACAAPGGKTGHLIETAALDLTVLELDEARMPTIQQNLGRITPAIAATKRSRINLQCADASRIQNWWGGAAFDRILLDAPCSSSGIVRRHPDIAWLRKPQDLEALTQIQARLLRELWRTLKPQGRLLYCTCSIFKAEGQAQIDAFLINTPSAKLIGKPLQLLPCNSPNENHDGFFYALLEKNKA